MRPVPPVVQLRLTHESPDGEAHDPWKPTAPYLAALLHRRTGIDVAPAARRIG